MANIIKCLLKRVGGTKVELNGKVYHFKPVAGKADDPDEPHIASVEDPAHIWRLLSIKEAYALLDPEEPLPARPKAEPGQVAPFAGKAEKVVTPVKITSDDGTEIILTDLTPEDLRTLARDTFKIVVHHKWSDQTVIAKIIEKTRGE